MWFHKSTVFTTAHWLEAVGQERGATVPTHTFCSLPDLGSLTLVCTGTISALNLPAACAAAALRWLAAANSSCTCLHTTNTSSSRQGASSVGMNGSSTSKASPHHVLVVPVAAVNVLH